MDELWKNISNIKCSFTLQLLKPYIRHRKNVQVSKFGTSYFIIRWDRYVFSVYYSGHVNVTGLQRLSDVHKVYHYLKTILIINKLIKFQVDNITYTSSITNSNLKYITSFTSFLQTIEKHECVHTIKYSAQRFPGAFLKLKTSSRATVILFASGKYNIVGCNTLKMLHDVCCAMTSLMSNK